MIRTYTELSKFNTFEDRYSYLKLNGQVGSDTFGFDRYLNQALYNSAEWQRVRKQVILRDNGCDLGIDGYDINGKIIIHHMNPINVKDIEERNSEIFNPEYLICVTHKTHNAIHYGDNNLQTFKHVDRTPGDTCLWRR